MKSYKEVIELLKQDKIAIENDCEEKLELLRKIFKNAFPEDESVLIRNIKYYFNHNGIEWECHDNFTKPQEIIKLSEIYEVPTLEEVKEYFKDAKEVRCLVDNKIYNISKINKYIDNEDGSFWCEKTSSLLCKLYEVSTNKYAEIISYKSNDIEVNNPIEVVKNGIFIPNSIINDFNNYEDLGKFIKQQLS